MKKGSEDVARRLQIFQRYANEPSQRAMASRLGIAEELWRNALSGTYPLSKRVALRIVEEFPELTLDWLFLGRIRGLTVEAHRRIEEIDRNLAASRGCVINASRSS